MMTMMEETHRKQEPHSSLPCVFEIPGEPAIVIDGVPNISSTANAFIPMDTTSESESKDSPGLGEWLVGRDVRKMFGDQYYSGKVVRFDEEMKWYRVEYEDGDFEDLEWCEIQEQILPLDTSISLKALALKIFNCEKPVCMYGENTVGLVKTDEKNITSKRETGEESHKTLVTKLERSWQVKENSGYERTAQGKINRPKNKVGLIKTNAKNIKSKREVGEENHKTLVTKLEGSLQVKENSGYERTTQGKVNRPKNTVGLMKTDAKTTTSKREMGEEDHKTLATKLEGNWQENQNVDYERTSQGKINRSKEIRRTINAEKQMRRIRNAIASNSAEGKTSTI